MITRQCADCSFGTTVAGLVAVNCPLAVYPGGLPKSKNVWLVNFGSWTSGQKGTCHSGTPAPLHLGLNYSDWIWLLKPFRHFALQHDTSTNEKLKKPEGFNFRRLPGQGEGELILLLWDQTCACWIVGRGSFLISILLVDVAHPSLVLLNLKLYFCRFHSDFQFHTKLHISPVHKIRMILRTVSPCLLLFLSHLWSEFATSRILFTFQFPKRRDIAAGAFTKATQMRQRNIKVMYDRKWWKTYYGWSTGRIDRLWQTRKNMKWVETADIHKHLYIKKPSPGSPNMALLSDREDLSPWRADQIESSWPSCKAISTSILFVIQVI